MVPVIVHTFSTWHEAATELWSTDRLYYTESSVRSSEIARPFLKEWNPSKESENPLHKALKQPSSLQKTTKHRTIIAFLVEFRVTIDTNRY